MNRASQTSSTGGPSRGRERGADDAPGRPGLRLLRVALAVAALVALSGCGRTYTVSKTVVAQNLMNATLEQLISQMNARFNAVQSLNLSVDITASTGGSHEGQIKEIPTSAGYILMRKPGDLRVLMLAPILRSRALDMVSDGKSFKLLITIPTKPARAIEGAEVLTTPSKNGLENIRPSVIRDALLVPAVQPDEYIDPTENLRILPPARGHKEAIEEPDYDIAFVRVSHDHVLEHVRVIHISRVNLLPYEQDIYDPSGHVVTRVEYSRYQKFAGVDFPMSMIITRPLDEYTLKIEVNKAALNQKLDDEQFALPIPENVPIQKM